MRPQHKLRKCCHPHSRLRLPCRLRVQLQKHPHLRLFLSFPRQQCHPPRRHRAASDVNFACQVNSQTPQNDSGMGRGEDFEARWQVSNIGQKAWDSDNADYRYTSGDKFHKVAIYDLNSSVPPGGNTEIVVAMKAPSDPGTYTTTWKITSGKTQFCTMNLTIIVN